MEIPISKKQAKVLLRAATQFAKVTGKSPERALAIIVKSLAQNMSLRNKG